MSEKVRILTKAFSGGSLICSPREVKLQETKAHMERHCSLWKSREPSFFTSSLRMSLTLKVPSSQTAMTTMRPALLMLLTKAIMRPLDSLEVNRSKASAAITSPENWFSTTTWMPRSELSYTWRGE